MKTRILLFLLLTGALSAQTRVNVGGPQYTDSNGLIWSADTGCTSASTYSRTNPISGTNDPTLFHTARIGNQVSCSYPVTTPAIYTVTLLFAETDPMVTANSGVAGARPRVMSIYINGQEYYSPLNVMASSAFAAAYTLTTPYLSVLSETSITININQIAYQAMLSGIDIEPVQTGGGGFPSVTISAPVFTGSGLNDATSGGTFSGAPSNHSYLTCVSSTGTPDHFTFAEDGGMPGTGVAMTGAFQSLANGVQIKWSATTGHTVGNCWTITATANGSVVTESFVQAGVGALVTRGAQDKLRDIVSLLDFGADPTGATDSTAALQYAANYARLSGKTLELPAGLIKISVPITINQTAPCNFQIQAIPPIPTPPNTQFCGIKIHGQGIGKTIIWQATAGVDALTAIAGGVSQYPFIETEGFSLYGPDGGACPGNSGNGIHVSGLQTVLIRGVYVLGFCGAGKAGVWLDGPEGFLVEDSRVDLSDRGFKLTGDANDGTFLNDKTSQVWTAGFDFANVQSGTFAGLSAQAGNCDGMRLQGVKGAVFTSLYFESNNVSLGCYGLNALSDVQNNQFYGITSISHRDTIRISGVTGAAGVSSRNLFYNSVGPDGNQGGIIIDNAYSIGNTWINYWDYFFVIGTSTSSAAASSTTLTVTSFWPVYVGEVVAGTNIAAGTTVSAVSGSYSGVTWSGTLTLSLATTGIVTTPVSITGAGYNPKAETFIGGNFVGINGNVFGLSSVFGDSLATLPDAARSRVHQWGDPSNSNWGYIDFIQTGGSADTWLGQKWNSSLDLDVLNICGRFGGIGVDTTCDTTHSVVANRGINILSNGLDINGTNAISGTRVGTFAAGTTVNGSAPLTSIPGGSVSCPGGQHLATITLTTAGTLSGTCN